MGVMKKRKKVMFSRGQLVFLLEWTVRGGGNGSDDRISNDAAITE